MDGRSPTLVIPRRTSSLGDVVGRALDLAQRVAVDEVRLLQLESHERAAEMARRAAWLTCGAACLAIAWTAASVAAVVGLGDRFPLEIRLLIVAGFQALLGAGFVAAALRRRGAGR